MFSDIALPSVDDTEICRTIFATDTSLGDASRDLPELIHPSCVSYTYTIPTWKTYKTDNVPNNETSEIKRDLCPSGSTGGGPSSFLTALVLLSTIFCSLRVALRPQAKSVKGEDFQTKPKDFLEKQDKR